MKKKLLDHHLIVNTDPNLFDLNVLLPDDFRTITQFPIIPNQNQLMFMGYANLRKMSQELSSANATLKDSIHSLQKNIDWLDELNTGCIQTMAEYSGCTCSILKTLQAKGIISPISRCCPCTCQFGQPTADLCVAQGNANPHSSQGAPCIFAHDTPAHVDNHIGELIGLITHYEKIREQLRKYRTSVQYAADNTTLSKPVFLRWRPKNYLRPGNELIHFRLQQVDGVLRAKQHRAVYIGPKSDSISKIPDFVCRDLTSGKEFDVKHTNRTITMHDYNRLRDDRDFARIWLKNYTWNARDEKGTQILAVLHDAFTKLLLD